jgi:molybdopterin synthase catalytic subunit
MTFKITDQPLSIDEAYRAVVREDCGAVCVFVGTVRNHHEGKLVRAIDYSAFREMAEKEFAKIAAEAPAAGLWYIAHRVGKLLPTDASVIIAVSAPHRAEAFEACRYAIERLKKLAPIWKEEFYDAGKAWISG